MNILYLCDEYPPGRHGGIGTVVQMLARQMVKKGHVVVVAGFYDWGYGGEDHFKDDGVMVYRYRKLFDKAFGFRTTYLQRALFKASDLAGILHYTNAIGLKGYKSFLESLIAKYNIDLIEMPDYNDYVRTCKGYLPFPHLSVPVVVKLHGTLTYFAREAGRDLPQYITQIEKDILEKAKAVCSVSEYTASHTKVYLDYEKPVKVIYNGIDTNVDVEADKVCNKVIYTGSLAEKKGIYQLMHAWNKVIEEIPDARLHVFGKGPIEKLIPLLNAEAVKTVFFEGHVDRAALYKSLSSSELAVFPSFAECFALGPMEAMACGTAVIYTTRTSGPELITHKKNGWLIDPADISDIANSIIYLLKNKQITAQLARQGRATTKEKFDIGVITSITEQYYQSVLINN